MEEQSTRNPEIEGSRPYSSSGDKQLWPVLKMFAIVTYVRELCFSLERNLQS
jgi:hypothetical protein